MIKHLLCSLSNPTITCQNNANIIRKAHSFCDRKHVVQIQAVNRTRDGKAPIPFPPCPNSIVCSNQSSPTSKTNDSPATWPLEQFIVDEANSFVEDFTQQSGIVRLQFMGMTKKQVRLVWNQFLGIDLLNTNEHITVTQVFLHLYPRGRIFGISNPTNWTGLNNDIQLRKSFLKQNTLIRSQWNTLVWRSFSFSENSQAQRVVGCVHRRIKCQFKKPRYFMYFQKPRLLDNFSLLILMITFEPENGN